MALERRVPPARLNKTSIRDQDGILHYSEVGPLLGLDEKGTILVRGRAPLPEIADPVKEVLFSLPERRDIRGEEQRGFNARTLARVLDIPISQVQDRMDDAVSTLEAIGPKASVTIGFDEVNGYYKAARGPEKVLEKDDIEDHFTISKINDPPSSLVSPSIVGTLALAEPTATTEVDPNLPFLHASLYQDGLTVTTYRRGKPTRQDIYGYNYLPIAVYLLRHARETLVREEVHADFPGIPNSYSFATYLGDVKKYLEHGLGFKRGDLFRQTMGRSAEFELQANVLWDIISDDRAPFLREEHYEDIIRGRFIERIHEPTTTRESLPALHVEEQGEGLLVMADHSGEHYEKVFSGGVDHEIARYILLRPNRKLTTDDVYQVYPRGQRIRAVRKELEYGLGFKPGTLIRTGTGRHNKFELAADVTWSNGTPKDIPLVGSIVLLLDPATPADAEKRTSPPPLLSVSEKDGELHVTVSVHGEERTKRFVSKDQKDIARYILQNAGKNLTYTAVNNALEQPISLMQLYRVKNALTFGLGFPKDTLFYQKRGNRRKGGHDTFRLQAQVVFEDNAA